MSVFKVEDVVKIKNIPGPNMIVRATWKDGRLTKVSWFNTRNELEEKDLPTQILEKVDITNGPPSE